jgi:hypothetical protein
MQRQRVGEPEVALGVGLGRAADVAALDVADHQQAQLARQRAGLLVGAVAGRAPRLEEGDVRLHARHVAREHRQHLPVEGDASLGRRAARHGFGERLGAWIEADHCGCSPAADALG